MGFDINIILLSLIIITLLSITGNVYLLKLVRKYYRVKNKVRLFPYGFNYSAEEPPPPKPLNNEIQVAIFGDSRAEEWPSPEIDGFNFLNRGKGSLTTPELKRLYADKILPLSPKIIVLQMGINDLKVISLYPKRKDLIVKGCIENINQIITWASEKKAFLILTTIFPVGQTPIYRRFLSSGNILEEINQVNTYIKSKANEKIYIFDTFSLLSNPNYWLKREFSRDEFHLNDTGYKVINEKFKTILLGLKERPEPD